MAEYKLLINGELVNSSSGKTVNDIGPATGEPIAHVPESTLEDVDRAVRRHDHLRSKRARSQ